MLFEPLLQAFHIGVFLFALPVHLAVVGLGLFIRGKLRSRRARWIWLGILLLMVVACELQWNGVGGWDRLPVCFAASGVFDLLVGTSFIAIPDTIHRLLQKDKDKNTARS